tara:strand:- start:898 stop:1269 length:372 start_codon:yes stop_codon:yes gene_type:complete
MKTAIALAALLGVGTAPALAGDFYTNVEYNGSSTGSDFTGSTTDIHLGYEGDLGKDNLGYYIQGGPAVVNSDDTTGNDTQFSGKTGISVAATEKLDIYGELSIATVDDSDNTWGSKLGAKYKF